MKKQNYSNYKRYYIPHHFIFLPLLAILLCVGIKYAFTDATHKLEWTLFSICIFCIFYLTIMLRQHYALGNQDRIVRLEFRLRYFQIFNHSSDSIEKKISFAQIAALRFANDTEFKSLLEDVLKNNLSAEEIKRSIKDWQPDNNRL